MTEAIQVITDQARDFEWLFCGGVLQDYQYTRKHYGHLDPALFTHSSLQKFWAAVLAGKLPVMAAQEVGPSFARQLLSWKQSAELIEMDDYAAGLRSTAYLRTATRTAQDIATAAMGRNINQVQDHARKLADLEIGGKVGGSTFAEVVPSVIPLIHDPTALMLKTFLPPFDRMTGGLQRKALTILAARPGVGKTTLALQWARGMAHMGKKVHFFSFEMAKERLVLKAACSRAGVKLDDHKAGRTTKDQRKLIEKYAYTLQDEMGHNLIISDRRTTTQGIWHELALSRPDVVIIDHLRKVGNPGDQEVTRLGQMTTHLAAASIEYNCGMLVLAQLNRGLMGRDNKRPVMSDLRGSGQIEEDADFIYFIHRENYHDPDAIDQHTELRAAKDRDGGGARKVLLEYDAKHEWFKGVGA